MARYIDADALKERLEDFSKWCRDGRKQGVDFVLDCPLPNMPTADVAPRAEWISVEERLPDGNGNFLTVDRKGDMMVCYWEKRFGWFASVCKKNAITHWTPLPEPPKGE